MEEITEKEASILRCLKKGMGMHTIEILQKVGAPEIRRIRDKHGIAKPDMSWRGNIMV